MTGMDLQLPLTPFVYFVRRRRGTQDELDISDRPATRRLYGLWRQREGTTTLIHASGRFDLRPGGVALTEAGTGVVLQPGARVSHCAFSLLPRIRQVRSGGEVTINVNQAAEPPWGEVIGRPLPVLAPPGAAAAARELIDTIELSYWRDAPRRFAAALRVGAWLCDLAANDESPPADDLLERCDRLIALRYPQPITVADLARELGVSTTSLTERYRAKRSDTPGRALRARRMIEARKLLHNPDMSLSKIFGRVGYRDRNAFIRAFRQQHGTPPERWRRQQRERHG